MGSEKRRLSCQRISILKKMEEESPHRLKVTKLPDEDRPEMSEDD